MKTIIIALTILLVSVIGGFSHQFNGLRMPIGSEEVERYISDEEMEFFRVNSSPEVEILRPYIEDMIEIRKSPIKCEECKVVVATLQTILQSNETEKYLKEIAYQVCLKLHLNEVTPFVCHGVIREFTSEVVYVMTTRFLDPILICDILKLCTNTSTFSTPRNENHLPQSRFSNQMNNNNNNNNNNNAYHYVENYNSSNIGTFIQISDIHFDSRYKVGTNAECPRPLCCREVCGVPPPGSRAAGPWGDYNCDTPIPLLDNLFDQLNSLDPKPDFLIYTGDNTAHDIWAETQNIQLNRTEWLYNHMREKLPDWEVYPVLGNHESFPVDQFPNPPSNSWLMNGAADAMLGWVSNQSLETYRKGGYYTTLIRPGLRFIGLNTQYCDTNNFWLILDWVDPTDQLLWFNQTLYEASQAGEKVLIAGHIPTPHSGCLVGYSTQFWNIIYEYHSSIVSMFFGHTHEDSFQVFLDPPTNSIPIAMGYISPSVTPYTEKNPSFRVYSYDRSTFEILDYTQYYTNLTANNLADSVTWLEEYSAKSAYLLPDLSPSSWYNLVTNVFPINATMVENYNIWFDASYDPIPSPCDETCVEYLQCTLLSSTAKVYQQCIQQPPNLIDWSTIMNILCP